MTAFSFGLGTGRLQAAIELLGIDPDYVEPSVWKRSLGATSDKQSTKQLALTLLPHGAQALTSEAKAEASLIALYLFLQLRIRPTR